MSHGPARTPRPAPASESLADYFRRFAVLFGNQATQDLALQYLEFLQSGGPDGAANRRFPAKARRDVLDRSGWNPAQIVGPFQSFVGDVLGSEDACFILTERVTARKDSRADGVGSHYSPAHGGVVQGHLGQYLVYQSSRGTAVVDARLDAPSQPNLTKLDRSLEMLEAARSQLASTLVLAPSSLGDDSEFRARLRERGFDYLVEVSASTSLFAPNPSLADSPNRYARSRRALRSQDLILTTAAGAASSLRITSPAEDAADGVQYRESRLAVFESRTSTVGPSATLLVTPSASGDARYFLTSLSLDQSIAAASLADVRLDRPAELLTVAPGESPLDRYDVSTQQAWLRHAVLVMLASFWRTHLAEPRALAATTQPAAPSGQMALRPSPVPSTFPSARELPAHLREDRGARRQSRWPVLLGCIVLLLAAVIGWGVLTARSAPALGQIDNIRVSMFYHPPNDGTSIGALVSRARQVIFTRGDEAYLAQMRERGFKGEALQYLVANETSGPERARAAQDRCTEYLVTGNDVSGIAQDFCATLHGDERNFMHNRRGERLYSTLTYQENGVNRTRYYYLMNPGATGWRDYFAAKAQQNLAELPYNGIFLDNIDLSMVRAAENETNSNGTPPEYANDRLYRDAVRGYLESLRSRLAGATIWANLTEGQNAPDEYDSYLPYLDGVMNEYFVTLANDRTVGPNQWSGQMQLAEKVLGHGKSFLAVSHGPRTDTNRMRLVSVRGP